MKKYKRLEQMAAKKWLSKHCPHLDEPSPKIDLYELWLVMEDYHKHCLNKPNGRKKIRMNKEIINQIKALITNKVKDTYYTEVAISVDDDGNLCFIGIDTNCDGEIYLIDTIAPTGEKK